MRTGSLMADVKVADPGSLPGSRLSAWLRLGLGLGVLWLLAYIVLPWASGLPAIRPVMEVLERSGGDATHYFYTQSEETALAQMYVRNVLAGGVKGRRP
jgi:hypothetical protein